MPLSFLPVSLLSLSLSSILLWSRNVATMVTWHYISPIRTCLTWGRELINYPTLNSSSIPKLLGLHDKFAKSLRTASWKLIVISSKSSKFAKNIHQKSKHVWCFLQSTKSTITIYGENDHSKYRSLQVGLLFHLLCCKH